MLVTISEILASDKRILSFYDPVPFEALTYEGLLDLEEDEIMQSPVTARSKFPDEVNLSTRPGIFERT